jgi:hypothetical protein
MAAQLIDTSHLRQLDEVITEEARRIHAEHIDGGGDWVSDYRKHAIRGAYDGQKELVALRAALRRGMELARQS